MTNVIFDILSKNCYNNKNIKKGVVAINRVVDRLAAVVFCAFLSFFAIKPLFAIVVVLAAITITSLIEYFEDTWLIVSLEIIAIIASFFTPYALFLFTVLAYDAFTDKKTAIAYFFCILPLFLNVRGDNLFFIALGTVVAILLAIMRYRTDIADKIHQSYIKQRDDYDDADVAHKYAMSRILKEQDNEINVAILAERNRIAREIHDNVGHLLSSSILQLGALMTVNRDENTNEMLGALKDTLSEGMNSVRSSVHNLRNESIDLKSQLDIIIDGYTFCEIELSYDVSEDLDANLKYAVIAIIKECLTNTSKHSDATKVKISVYEHPRLLQLVVSDNGSKVIDNKITSGMGIENIKQRVKALGGTLNIGTSGGFSIFASFVLKNEGE